MPEPVTLTLSLSQQGQQYKVTLEHSDPEAAVISPPARTLVTFDLAALGAYLDPTDYGSALTRAVFRGDVRDRWLEVSVAADLNGRERRLVVEVEPDAVELLAQRWELLRCPRHDFVLATSQRVVLSRRLEAGDWRPVKRRARGELRALLAVSAPDPVALANHGLAEIDRDAELQRATRGLRGLQLQTLTGPCTLTALVDALRQGPDVLYLMAHGGLTPRGLPKLVLEDATRQPDMVPAQQLSVRLEDLPSVPQLVVLISCESAGNDVHTGHLAAELLRIGVPTVLAMQGKLTMETAELLMPAFFDELARHGRLDLALAVARGKVREHHDAWMPVLYSRLKDGRLWQDAGPTDPAPLTLASLLAQVDPSTLDGAFEEAGVFPGGPPAADITRRHATEPASARDLIHTLVDLLRPTQPELAEQLSSFEAARPAPTPQRMRPVAQPSAPSRPAGPPADWLDYWRTRLDRVQAYTAIAGDVTDWESNGDAVYLVRGEPKQQPGLLPKRMLQHLGGAANPKASVIAVGYPRPNYTTTNAAEFEKVVAACLRDDEDFSHLPPFAPPRQMLAQAARQSQLVLLLGAPLRRLGSKPLYALQEFLVGLRDFLGPADGRNPVRVFLTVEEPEGGSVYASLYKAIKRSRVRFKPLDDLHFPPWDEVAGQLAHAGMLASLDEDALMDLELEYVDARPGADSLEDLLYKLLTSLAQRTPA